VLAQSVHAAAGRGIPQFHGCVKAGGSKHERFTGVGTAFSGWRPPDGVDLLGVLAQVKEGPGRGFPPQFHCGVVGAGRQQPPRGVPLHRVYLVLVAQEAHEGLGSPEPAHVNRVVRGATRESTIILPVHVEHLPRVHLKALLGRAVG